MMTDSDERASLNGCGMTVLFTVLLVVLGLAAGVIFVLFMFGSWLGGQ